MTTETETAINGDDVLVLISHPHEVKNCRALGLLTDVQTTATTVSLTRILTEERPSFLRTLTEMAQEIYPEGDGLICGVIVVFRNRKGDFLRGTHFENCAIRAESVVTRVRVSDHRIMVRDGAVAHRIAPITIEEAVVLTFSPNPSKPMRAWPPPADAHP